MHMQQEGAETQGFQDRQNVSHFRSALLLAKCCSPLPVWAQQKSTIGKDVMKSAPLPVVFIKNAPYSTLPNVGCEGGAKPPQTACLKSVC